MNNFFKDFYTKDFEMYRDVIVIDYDKKLNEVYDFIIKTMKMAIYENKEVQNHESDDVVSNHWVEVIDNKNNDKYHLFKVQVRSKNKKLYKVVAIEEVEKENE